jgi:phospholipase C
VRGQGGCRARRCLWLCLAGLACLLVACQPSPTSGAARAHNQKLATTKGKTRRDSKRPEPTQLALARKRIKHVVFVIKENRTFDNLFGRMPGVDGARSGVTCDGTRVPLRRAPDIMPNDILHSFSAGIVSINGGKMNCFNDIYGGTELQGYVQYHQADVPNYWAYAKRFAIADHFFSSVYGPTPMEHLWTIAAQSDRFVDSERPDQAGTREQGQYCKDRMERMESFRRMTPAEKKQAFQLEEQAAVSELAQRFWI